MSRLGDDAFDSWMVHLHRGHDHHLLLLIRYLDGSAWDRLEVPARREGCDRST